MVRRFILLFASTALGVLLACGVALAAVSATPDPGTVDASGQVSAILRLGDRVYLGGKFNHVNGEPRARLAAIDAATGELTDWNPGADGEVRALAASSDGTRIFAGGEFTEVGGEAHGRLAAIDAASGSVDAAWDPQADRTVRSLAVSGDRVYLGGDFTQVDGQVRQRLAMVDAATGELDANWLPAADDRVRKLAVYGDPARVYVGGDFSQISGRPRHHLAALGFGRGLPSKWQPNPRRPVLDFALTRTRVFTAQGGTNGGAVVVYGLGTGSRAWAVRGNGDVNAVTTYANRVYVGGHFTNLGGKARHGLAALDPRRGALDLTWRPRVGPPDKAEVWELTRDVADRRLYVGGEFTEVSGETHKRFARFSG
jgi:hypothetical protein